MVKVKLQPHPNSIKVHQIYLHIILSVILILAFFFISFLFVFLLAIAGFTVIYFLIERFVKRFTSKNYKTEIDNDYIVYNGERIPIKQLKTKSNPIEKRFGILKMKLNRGWIKGIHIEDWKRYFEN